MIRSNFGLGEAVNQALQAVDVDKRSTFLENVTVTGEFSGSVGTGRQSSMTRSLEQLTYKRRELVSRQRSISGLNDRIKHEIDRAVILQRQAIGDEKAFTVAVRVSKSEVPGPLSTAADRTVLENVSENRPLDPAQTLSMPAYVEALRAKPIYASWLGASVAAKVWRVQRMPCQQNLERWLTGARPNTRVGACSTRSPITSTSQRPTTTRAGQALCTRGRSRSSKARRRLLYSICLEK